MPLLDLSAQYAAIEADVRAAMDRVVRTQQFILGPEVDHLEREIADTRVVDSLSGVVGNRCAFGFTDCD